MNSMGNIFLYILLVDLITAGAFFTLAGIVLLSDAKNKTNQSFFLVAFAFGIIPLSNFFIDFSPSETIVRSFLNLVLFDTLLLAAALLYFSFCIFNASPFSLAKKILVALPFLFTPLVFSDYHIVELVISENALTEFTGGAAYSVILALAVFYFIAVLAVLWNKKSRHMGRNALQLRYIFWSLCISITLLLCSNMILPLFGIGFVPSFGPSILLVFAGATTYAIIKHRLMDIRIIIQRSVIYTLLIGVVVLVYIGAVFALQQAAGLETPTEIIWTSLLSVLLLVFTIPALDTWLRKVTDPIFFKDKVNYPQTLKRLNHIFSTEYAPEVIIPEVLELIQHEFKVRQVSLVFCPPVKKNHCEQYIVQNGDIDHEMLPVDDTLIHYFAKYKHYTKILLVEDFEQEAQIEDIPKSQRERIKKQLKELNAELCFSIVNRNGLLGFVCVSEKLSGEPFFAPDIEWFDICAKQMGVALERSQVFENLEDLVEQRTLELQQLNRRLEEMVQAKQEFVSVASHQLQTPLAVIKSIFSLLSSNQLGKLTKNKRIMCSEENGSQSGCSALSKTS